VLQDNKKIKSYLELHRSGWWQISDRWFIVRNSKNPSYTGPVWAKHLYDLVYIPEKSIFDAGHREELAVSENTKKKCYTIVVFGMLLAVFFLLGYFAG